MTTKDYNWTGKCLLIAEDSETSKRYFEAALRRTHISIVWARTGIDAVELARSRKPDLIFMDLDLPVMNGLVASRLIREEFPDMPIVAQTAHTNTGDAEASYRAGCNDFITKPISLDVLLRTLKKFLDS